MDTITNRYILAFDEINSLISTSYTLNSGDSEKVIDDLYSVLINAYQLGIQHCGEMLQTNLKPKSDDLEFAIYLMIDGKTFADRAREHIQNNDMTALIALGESEFHRVYNTAVYDGAREANEENGDVMKTWITAGDERVRDTHWLLEGASVGLNERFYTSDGDSARFPGDFSNPANNVNCRCVLSYERSANNDEYIL